MHYSRNAANLGANGNYRHALTLAEADWVVVMGADDLMLPTYVATVRALVVDHASAAVVVEPGGECSAAATAARSCRAPIGLSLPCARVWRAPPHHGVRELRGERLSASLLRANWTYFPSLCWRRDLVASIGFRTGLDVVQDLALLLDVVAAGGSLVLGDETVFLYRRHPGSDSRALRAATGTRVDEEREFFGDHGRREPVARVVPRGAVGPLAPHLTAERRLPGARGGPGSQLVVGPGAPLRHTLTR